MIAVAVDVGQGSGSGGEDWEAIRNRALAAGAVEAVVVDARAEMAEEFCVPALMANAKYEGKYPLVSALSRPVIVRRLVDQARKHSATAVAHGCTGKGNDQVRFEVGTRALAPDLDVIAPARDWGLTRENCIDYAEKWDIPLSVTKEKLYSIDENLWGRAIECGAIEDPWNSPPEDVYTMTRPTATEPAEFTVTFEAGMPVALDAVSLDAQSLIARLNELVGSYGYGRLDMVENRRVGIKSRETYECPAALALLLAHSDLEDLTLERDLHHEKSRLEPRWSELVYDGLWFSPLKRAIDAFFVESQRHVTGEVRLRLESGRCWVAGRRSPLSLYDHGLATYDVTDTFRHQDAEGFVRLWGLGVATWSAVQENRAGGSPTGIPNRGAPQVEAAARVRRGDDPVARPPERGHGGRRHGLLVQLALRQATRRRRPRRLAGPCARPRARRAAQPTTNRPRLIAALDRVEAELHDGSFTFAPDDEDIHTAVERRVTELAGDIGAKLHTGRSRNDQVATDLRLYAKRELNGLATQVVAVQEVLLARAKEAGDAYLPGYTHLQRAQPVLLAHHLLAHGWALSRDVDRLVVTIERLNVSPLGAGALAGSSLPLDPDGVAKDLGFAGRFENSLDAVSDRDFVAESLFDLSLLAIHLSRIGEEVVIWSTEEFGFATLDDAFATGSSMLPQKKNPDVGELVRGKSGRLIGNLTGLLATLKGLPLSYNRDMQEDKEPLFDSIDQIGLALDALSGLLSTVQFHTDRMQAAASGSEVAAVDLAEWLVEGGTPFRQAHAVIGGLVHDSIARRVPLEELVAAHPALGAEALRLLEPGVAVTRRLTPGSTGPMAVKAQLERFVRRLELDRGRLRPVAAAPD